MTVASGALEQAFAKVESAYGTLATPSATDAIRHLELALNAKNNREPNPAKRGTPDVAAMLPRRKTATWNLASALWEPSGALGTPSYLGALLKAGMGAQTTPNLNTTVAVSPAATATGCTLTSATGLAVGDVGVFTVAGVRQITRVKTLAGAAITYDALSAAPTTPGAFVAGVTYKQASTITESLSIFLFHTDNSMQRSVSGAIVNQIEIRFDGTREVTITAQGPAKALVRAGVSQPGAHTTAGDPASGTVGNLYLDGAAFLVQSATITMVNNQGLRNTELGTATASGHFRENRRSVSVAAAFYLEDASILDTADALGTDVFRVLVGDSSGAMVGAVCPKVEWEVPDVPTAEGPITVQATGTGLATSGNDQLYLAEL